ncbi:hypothetical protein ACTXT7_012347 [Hymenolepis weldensis]
MANLTCDSTLIASLVMPTRLMHKISTSMPHFVQFVLQPNPSVEEKPSSPCQCYRGWHFPQQRPFKQYRCKQCRKIGYHFIYNYNLKEAVEIIGSSKIRTSLPICISQQPLNLLGLNWFNQRYLLDQPIDATCNRVHSATSTTSFTAEMMMIRDRVVIPSALKRAVLQQFHSSLPSVSSIKSITRTFAYRPGMHKITKHLLDSTFPSSSSCTKTTIATGTVVYVWALLNGKSAEGFSDQNESLLDVCDIH